MPPMISYVTIGTDDLEAALAFYDPVMAALGFKRAWAQDGWAEYEDAAGGAPTVLLCKPFNGEAARAGNGVMVGLHAASREAVDAFHAAALANGGADEGAPGERAYGEGYYLAYVRDPTGNKLSAFYKPR